ncbi:hypothetical protein MKQ70_32700 [Chitinophaga sedimenti]|uniref:hypothetical protein n=1 Tax=Chitinophaga sedimenti TaxID=2033606 RepID=UPI002005FAEE|nr:hypothetical protein [Chitinophaga sedimenti]MCK7559476.1 hypothetical protein [Chitinophaga sedimenti]
MALYQHQGILEAVNKQVKNKYNVDGRLTAFIKKARQDKVDLALAPEYCCPLTIINDIIRDGDLRPLDGALWVLGGESITLPELKKLQIDYNDVATHIHFEENIKFDMGDFVDPLFYFFRGTHNGHSKLIVLVQFKTAHMGARDDPFERDHLVQGKTIYVLRNSPESVHFISLVCSEAMEFQTVLSTAVMSQLRWKTDTYLIYNPQMNPNPSHEHFRRFREFIFQAPRKEIITLNWHGDSKIQTKPLFPNKSARSSILIKSPDSEGITKRIKGNHKRGVYYFYGKKDHHIFVFNSLAHYYSLKITPADITEGVASRHLRDGPNNIQTYFLMNKMNWLKQMTKSATTTCRF